MSSGAPAPCVRGPGERFQCHRRRDNLIIDGEYRSGDAIFPFPEWGSRRLATARRKESTSWEHWLAQSGWAGTVPNESQRHFVERVY